MEELQEFLDKCNGLRGYKIVSDKEGKPRGFGFGTYETEDFCNQAIEQFNGQMFNGRRIRVERANKETN